MKRTIKKTIRLFAKDDATYYLALKNLIKLRYSYKFLFDSSLRSYPKRLEKIRNKHKGKRCFIMGNGPSLNNTPLDLLSDDYVWGVNRVNLLFDRISWRPKFYTAIDTVVVPDNRKEIAGLISSLQETIFFFPLDFRLRGILPSAENVYWYKEAPIDESIAPYGYFSVDPVKFVRSSRTVTIAALQLAVFLGFDPIYLIGCDTDYRRKNVFVERRDKSGSVMVGTANNDTDHFTGQYFGKGKLYNPPSPERMIFNYEQAKRVTDKLGVNVYNATIGGKLEVFPRVNFTDLF